MADEPLLDLITLTEASAVLKYKSNFRLRRAIRDGEIACFRVGGRKILLSKVSFLRWVIKQRQESSASK